jgi:glutamate-5-semialdehyde dehydrogenase
MTETPVPNILTTALESARQAFFALSQFSGADRDRGLRAMAKGLEEGLDLVLEANTLDLETSRDMAVPAGLVGRLKLTPDRLLKAVELLEQLADLPDPLQRVINAPYQLKPTVS